MWKNKIVLIDVEEIILMAQELKIPKLPFSLSLTKLN